MTRNRFEAAFAAANPDLAYEPIKLSYTLSCNYTPDFVDHDNKTIYETKGLWEAQDRRKILAVKEQHPGWRIVMVFQQPTRKIAKLSKTTYAAWCDKHGIEWQHFKR
jgi:hypothetical protein